MKTIIKHCFLFLLFASSISIVNAAQLVSVTGSTWVTSGDANSGNTGVYGVSNMIHVGSADIPVGSVATGYLEQKVVGSAVTFQIDTPATVFAGGATEHFMRYWIRAVKTGTLGADATQSTIMNIADPSTELQFKTYSKTSIARQEGFGVFCSGTSGTAKGLAGCDPVIAVPNACIPLDTWVEVCIRTVYSVNGGIYFYLNGTLCAKYTRDTTGITLSDMQGDLTWIWPTFSGVKWQICAPIQTWSASADNAIRPKFSLNAVTDYTAKAFLPRFPEETLGAFWSVTGTATTVDTLFGNSSNPIMRSRLVISGTAGQTMTMATIDKIGTLPYDDQGWSTLLFPDVYIPSGASFTLTANNDAGSPLVTLTCDGTNLQQGGSTVLANWDAADRFAILLQFSSTGTMAVTLRDQTKLCSASQRCVWSANLASWTPQALGTVSLAIVLGSANCETEGMDVCRQVFTFGIDSLTASQHTLQAPNLTDAYLVSGNFSKGEECFAVPGGGYPFRSSSFPRHRTLVLFGNSGCRTSQWMSFCHAGMTYTHNLYFIRADLGSINDISDGLGGLLSGPSGGYNMTVAQRDSLVAGLITNLITSTAALVANGNKVVLTTMCPREMDSTYDEMQRQAIKVYSDQARVYARQLQTTTSLIGYCDFESEVGTPLSLFTTGDATHPNAAGATVLATLLATRILTPTRWDLRSNYSDPGVANVLSGSNYTYNGVAQTGTATVPSVGNVLSGSGTFGAGGTALTPTLTLPTAANTIAGSGIYGNPSSPITPLYVDPASSAVWHGVSVGVPPRVGTKVGTDITNLTAANVKYGVAVDNVTGTFSSGVAIAGAVNPTIHWAATPANVTSLQIPTLVEGESRTVGVAFSSLLRTDTITGTPVITESTTTDLSFSSIGSNSVPVIINGSSVPVNQAVTFVISGQKVAHSPYTLQLRVSTSGGQTILRNVQFYSLAP